MLNRLLKIMILMITVSAIQSASAILFSGEVLKPKIFTKDDITIVILGDIHKDTSYEAQETKQQMDDILEIAEKYNAYLIVEDMPREKDEIRKISPLGGLCIKAKERNITNINSDCRYSYGKLDLLDKTMAELRSFKNEIFQQHFKQSEEQLKRLNELPAGWKRDQEYRHYRNNIFELNTAYELYQALQSKKNKLVIIAVGAYHMEGISNLIQEILPFKSVLRKNYIRAKVQDTLTWGPSEKIFPKLDAACLNYRLDLPQFFDEALKAPAIQSRL